MTGAWWTRAKPGDKVVCVALPTRANEGEPCLAIETGKVYTICSVEIHQFLARCDGVGFSLTCLTPFEIFAADLFRPVERDRTERGMAILNKLLVPAKEDA